MSNSYKNAFLGHAIGDALGVPYEFHSREKMMELPITNMVGFGTYNQPPGTWSDDTSLMLCLADSLTHSYNTEAIAQNFLAWRDKQFWAARRLVFDIGGTTQTAIENYRNGIPAEQAGPSDEKSNGNGALMRMLPMAFYTMNMDVRETWDAVRRVGSITHGHIVSNIACYLYVQITKACLSKKDINETLVRPYDFLHDGLDIGEEASMAFNRIWDLNALRDLPESSINSGGYVIDTLESSIWCLLNSTSYTEAVFKAINLGGDTDTTAAVTGGMAGIHFGLDVPNGWHNNLARRMDIVDLASRFECSMIDRGVTV